MNGCLADGQVYRLPGHLRCHQSQQLPGQRISSCFLSMGQSRQPWVIKHICTHVFCCLDCRYGPARISSTAHKMPSKSLNIRQLTYLAETSAAAAGWNFLLQPQSLVFPWMLHERPAAQSAGQGCCWALGGD